MFRRTVLAAAAAAALCACAPSPMRWRLSDPGKCPPESQLPVGIGEISIDPTPPGLREGVLGEGAEQRRLLKDAVSRALADSQACAAGAAAGFRLRGRILLFDTSRIGMDFPTRLAIGWRLEYAVSGKALWTTVTQVDSTDVAGWIPRSATNRFIENRNAVMRGAIRLLLARLRILAQRLKADSQTL